MGGGRLEDTKLAVPYDNTKMTKFNTDLNITYLQNSLRVNIEIYLGILQKYDQKYSMGTSTQG